MKIFWSWQSDTPGKTGRFLVRDALRKAIEHLRQPHEIEEPTSQETREALHLDQDIQGETGSPNLAATILDKIRVSDVFVADVTSVGLVAPPSSGVESKKLINSNVAIELGYALHALTDKRVLMVFNEHYGTYTDLPFDLRHRGGAIVFNAPPTATKEDLAEQKKTLRDRFVTALKPLIAEKARTSDKAIQTTAVFNEAIYFPARAVLAEMGEEGIRGHLRFEYEGDRFCFLRLMPPTTFAERLRLATLQKLAAQAPLLGTVDNTFVTLNEYGVLKYASRTLPPEGIAKLACSTQLFENGEIWCVDSSLIITDPAGLPQGLKYPFLHCPSFEKTYCNTFTQLTEFAKTIGVLPPWRIVVGVTGLKGVRLGTPSGGYLEQSRPINKPQISKYVVVNNDNSNAAAILEPFFADIYDSVGWTRPEKTQDTI
jgi:hypothetical protein